MPGGNNGTGMPTAIGGGGGAGMPPAMPGAGGARRKAIRLATRPPQLKYGLQTAPMIKRPRDNQGPKFGIGGGFKAGGF